MFVSHVGDAADDKAVREAALEVTKAEQKHAAAKEAAWIETVRHEAETWVDLMRAKRAKKKLEQKKAENQQAETAKFVGDDSFMSVEETMAGTG